MKRLSNQSGFTLIEVLIAIVIFAVGILAANAMQTTSILGNSKARDISQASSLGADRIETILSWEYDHPALIDDDDGKDETDADTDTNSGDGTNQDGDGDGVDDDGGEFGLADLVNPDGRTTSPDGLYEIIWNIAVDHPLPNTKTIRFYISPPNEEADIIMEFIKADII